MQENEKVNKRGISLQAKQAREAWQEQRLHSTRSRLCSCGLKLIVEHGYDETAAQDTAQAAGVLP